MMVWLQCFAKAALILGCIIGLIFMIASTVLVIVAIIRGGISAQIAISIKEEQEEGSVNNE